LKERVVALTGQRISTIAVFLPGTPDLFPGLTKEFVAASLTEAGFTMSPEGWQNLDEGMLTARFRR
jgi:hypothetical protein